MMKFNSEVWIKEFNQIRKRSKKISSAQIEAEIHEFRRQK